jgi:hypothetical protein
MLDRRNFMKSASSVAVFGAGLRSAAADPLAVSDPGVWRA